MPELPQDTTCRIQVGLLPVPRLKKGHPVGDQKSREELPQVDVLLELTPEQDLEIWRDQGGRKVTAWADRLRTTRCRNRFNQAAVHRNTNSSRRV